jgi:hypothetical protein
MQLAGSRYYPKMGELLGKIGKILYKYEREPAKGVL